MGYTKTNELLTEYGLEEFHNSIGDGWCNILRNLLEGFEKVSLEVDRIDCIKEKLGALRVYSAEYILDEDFADLTFEAELISSKTCEFCGELGEDYIFGFWHKTSCQKCASENKGAKPKTIHKVAFRGNFR